MKIDNVLFKKLTDYFAPSGYEDELREYILSEINEYIDDYTVDALGNLIAHKKGEGKKILFIGHMDQIGLMIKKIDDQGFMKFTTLGSFRPGKLIDQRITFRNGVQGVVCLNNSAAMDKLSTEDLYIDIAALNREDALQSVRVGDIAVFQSEYYENDRCIISRAIDDRVGCYLMIEAIKNIKNPQNDMYFAFAVQEEVGLRGAVTAGYGVFPDMCISLDVTGTGDNPAAAQAWEVGLNKGTGIKVKDGCLISSRQVKDYLFNLAAERNINNQAEMMERGGTDSGAVHMVKTGVKSGGIAVPARNCHSGNEIISKKDLISSMELVMAVCETPISW